MDSDVAGGFHRAILDAEAARLDAMIAADLAVLDGLLNESLSYVHSTGRCDSKETLLGFISEGAVRYLEIEHELDAVRETVSGLAAVTGTMRMRLVSGGVEKSISTRTTNLWVTGSSAWSLVAFQATTLPGS
ncbi:nuclear transport factor 2 family protein [Paeniglutamicibacter sp.]|uniref:nuclear transport factor 2 family protein n=1 Tax=Paeniglutamicibacter sp. TaxID=1934391 RepID=UPI003989C99D